MLFEFLDDYEDDREEIGFLRGNMFDNEFVSYKGMKFIKPVIKNKKDQELFEIMASSFKINDYNLYLDLHSEDKMIFDRFKEECIKLERLTKEYEKKHGPINLENADFDTFLWINGPWPWEGDISKYV